MTPNNNILALWNDIERCARDGGHLVLYKEHCQNLLAWYAASSSTQTTAMPRSIESFRNNHEKRLKNLEAALFTLQQDVRRNTP